MASDLPNHLVYLRLARPFAEALREVAAVAAPRGRAAAGEDYGFDVRAIATEPIEDAIARVVALGEQLVAAGKTEIVVSMLQDVRAGRPTEIEETAGYVVQRPIGSACRCPTSSCPATSCARAQLEGRRSSRPRTARRSPPR